VNPVDLNLISVDDHIAEPNLDVHMPFSGIRILEISAGIPGSYCGRLLTDAGADVVKLEPRSGDPLRRWLMN